MEQKRELSLDDMSKITGGLHDATENRRYENDIPLLYLSVLPGRIPAQMDAERSYQFRPSGSGLTSPCKKKNRGSHTRQKSFTCCSQLL